MNGMRSFFNAQIYRDNELMRTVISGGIDVVYPDARKVNNTEYRRASTFPADFDFCGENVKYITGMSVPPYMMHRVASSVIRQWFD